MPSPAKQNAQTTLPHTSTCRGPPHRPQLPPQWQSQLFQNARPLLAVPPPGHSSVRGRIAQRYASNLFAPSPWSVDTASSSRLTVPYQSFNRKSDLQRHYRIHTNERPYYCTHAGCSKTFIQRSALTVHNRTHTGEKPHRCKHEGCGKKFSDVRLIPCHVLLMLINKTCSHRVLQDIDVYTVVKGTTYVRCQNVGKSKQSDCTVLPPAYDPADSAEKLLSRSMLRSTQ